ncbi:MAG TPA: glycosyltransferase family 4 protein, partial [Terriglobales bacterium]
ELFIAHLAEGLHRRGLQVVVYTNGESSVNVEKRWTYPNSQWPLRKGDYAEVRDAEHSSWSIRDAASHCDLIHVNTHQSLTYTRFVQQHFVCTLHHAYEPELGAFYERYPDVAYVSISDFQRKQHHLPRNRTIYHGIDLEQYSVQLDKEEYLSFIGRIAPVKGTHSAIEVAHQTGIPLKIAGEVQPEYREYFERKIKPFLDGKFIEYVGPANFDTKNELLGHSLAMLFPIHWNEPFGLVMVEAMACETPVLALPGGSVTEIVRDGVSGFVCRSVQQMAKQARDLKFSPTLIRRYAEEHFSLDHMVHEYAVYYEAVLGEEQTQVA